ncbi:MAG: metallophosphoesterase [Christensenellales bacterium]
MLGRCAALGSVGLMNAIIVLLHLAVFWGVAESVQYAVTKRGRRPARLDYASAAAVIVTVLYLGVGWIQAKGVWQTNYAVDTQKEVGTLRVALLADAHVGTTFDGKGLKTHIARIQQQNPDVVLIAGDFVDEGTDRANMQAACRAAAKAALHVYLSLAAGAVCKRKARACGDELIAEWRKTAFGCCRMKRC